MTKRKSVFVILTLVAGLLSFRATTITEEGIEKGDSILTDNSNVYIKNAIEKNKGKFIILNFWSSYDAESRARNIKFANLARNDSSNVALISVSLDKIQSVYDETVKSDGINANSSFLVKNGFDSKTAQNYGFKNGEFGNFLIDPQGVIVLKNSNAEDFSAEILSSLN